MKVVNAQKIDMAGLGIPTTCSVYQLHLQVSNVAECAGEMIDMLADRSWVTAMQVIPQVSYRARAEKTITTLVNNIFGKVQDTVTEEFGEYLISHSAGCALEESHLHKKMPLAELWKEKITGNPGFDFHTESSTGIVVFGEAKYKATGSPYTVALQQISDFVDGEKDVSELVDLQHFASEGAITNASRGVKGFIAAFSLNAKNIQTIFSNALKSDEAKKLLCHTELYLIGIEIIK